MHKSDRLRLCILLKPIFSAAPALIYTLFAASPSGKMILLTKKKITMLTPPLRTVEPML